MEDVKKAEKSEHDPRQDPAQAAKNLVPNIADRLGLTENQIWYLLGQIAYDPYTEFIYSTWELGEQVGGTDKPSSSHGR